MELHIIYLEERQRAATMTTDHGKRQGREPQASGGDAKHVLLAGNAEGCAVGLRVLRSSHRGLIRYVVQV